MLHLGRALEGLWTPKWDIESYVESAKPKLCCWEVIVDVLQLVEAVQELFQRVPGKCVRDDHFVEVTKKHQEEEGP